MNGAPVREVYVERGVRLGADDGAAAWSFDLDLWGVCCQGADVDEAVARFAELAGPVVIAEIVTGDEQAFLPDLRAPTPEQVDATRWILREQRARSLALLASTPAGLLDRDDPQRQLPQWASWRTARQTLWHITDTESRYYLPCLGLPVRGRASDLERELVESAEHVDAFLDALATQANADETASGRLKERGRNERGERWTAVKVLRRLAWHERGELDALDALLARWRDG